MEPGGLDDQRVAAPPLGQPAAEIAEVGAEIREISSASRASGSL